MNGIVYLTGAGPGDYRLLTLRGREVLERADVVIYDYLADPRLLEFAPPTAEKIYVGKKAADHTLSQDKIIDLLIAKEDFVVIAHLAVTRPIVAVLGMIAVGDHALQEGQRGVFPLDLATRIG